VTAILKGKYTITVDAMKSAMKGVFNDKSKHEMAAIFKGAMDVRSVSSSVRSLNISVSLYLSSGEISEVSIDISAGHSTESIHARRGELNNLKQSHLFRESTLSDNIHLVKEIACAMFFHIRILIH